MMIQICNKCGCKMELIDWDSKRDYYECSSKECCNTLTTDRYTNTEQEES